MPGVEHRSRWACHFEASALSLSDAHQFHAAGGATFDCDLSFPAAEVTRKQRHQFQIGYTINRRRFGLRQPTAIRCFFQQTHACIWLDFDLQGDGFFLNLLSMNQCPEVRAGFAVSIIFMTASLKKD